MSDNINTEADDDVEGHTVRPSVVRPSASDDDDDVEGHGITRPQ
jgi:hypothetical protein